jgi:hypothetical protein
VTSQYLCFSTALTSSELAAWVQAVGSILAIGGAFWIASYQLRKTHADSLALEESRRRAAELDVAPTLAEVANRSWQAAGFLRAQLVDRATVHQVADGEMYLDIEPFGTWRPRFHRSLYTRSRIGFLFLPYS